MQDIINKANTLIEALPYIREFSGKTVVIKCGGSALTDLSQLNHIMQDIALLFFCGIRVVLVHGGGPDISALCEQLHLPVQFSQGQRVTDVATMEVVQMVLLGKTNRRLVTALNQHGIKAVGFSGQDTAFLKAAPLPNLGQVGTITSVDTTLLQTLLSHPFVPVIAPIAVDAAGSAYNVNADTVAASVAGALKAQKLILLTDVNGLYGDIAKPESRISVITVDEIKQLLQVNQINGGMIPKLQACCDAISQGVVSAHMIDGTVPHSLLLEIFSNEGIGTMVKA